MEWKKLKDEIPELGKLCLVFFYERESFSACEFNRLPENEVFWKKKTKYGGARVECHEEDRWLEIPRVKIEKVF